ncbi:MAG TPA: TlpA disulfide reductase family protein [Anaerolineales bacterium]|nr:TlpA disulfide reductase family protein [Anaerolineales bacterium]
MDETGQDLLRQAQIYLKKGNNSQALNILALHLKDHPDSVEGWWLLSFAVPDTKRQIDCLERVLHLRPSYVQARVRLDTLLGKPPSQPIAPPIKETPAPTSYVESKPITQPRSTPITTPPKPPVLKKEVKSKTSLSVFQIAILGFFGVIALAVLGGTMFFGMRVFAEGQQTLPQAQQDSNKTEISMPATWTPTVTATTRPTLTPYPTITPLGFSKVEALPTRQASGIEAANGYYAPNFTLVDVNTNERVSLDNYRGKAVLVFFWATWCPYCNVEISAVQMVHEAYSDDGLVVLAVNVGEGADAARQYGAAKNLTFSILNDAGRDVAADYAVTGYPTHYFIDASGVISSIDIGGMDYWSLVNKVKPLLGLP